MNIKEEFLIDTQGLTVLCAELSMKDSYDWEINKPLARLKLNYTEEDYKAFLSSIDFEYDNGFGGQELFGFVWFDNGAWLERGEYDGSEWWSYKSCPEIPNELK